MSRWNFEVTSTWNLDFTWTSSLIKQHPNAESDNLRKNGHTAKWNESEVERRHSELTHERRPLASEVEDIHRLVKRGRKLAVEV